MKVRLSFSRRICEGRNGSTSDCAATSNVVILSFLRAEMSSVFVLTVTHPPLDASEQADSGAKKTSILSAKTRCKVISGHCKPRNPRGKAKLQLSCLQWSFRTCCGSDLGRICNSSVHASRNGQNGAPFGDQGITQDDGWVETVLYRPIWGGPFGLDLSKVYYAHRGECEGRPRPSLDLAQVWSNVFSQIEALGDLWCVLNLPGPLDHSSPLREWFNWRFFPSLGTVPLSRVDLSVLQLEVIPV